MSTAHNRLAAIIGPIVFLGLYFATRQTFSGWVWIAGVAPYLPCLPILLKKHA